MKPLIYCLILITSLLSLGCGPDNSTKTKLFEDQRNALEKAKKIESSAQQQTQDIQQNVEKQTQ